MKRKIQAGASLLIHLFILIVTVRAVISYFYVGGDGNMKAYGLVMFRFFTVDSNVLLSLAGIPVMIRDIRILAGTSSGLTKTETLMTYVGTAGTTLTFAVVMLFLGPVLGYPSMFARNNLFMHLISPVLALAAFFLTDPGYTLRDGERWLGMIPCLVYGVIYFIEIVIITPERGGWPDFYMLNAGGRWYVSMALMFGGMFLICLIMTKVRQLIGKKKEAQDV